MASVLIVDDSKVMCLSLKKMCEKLGYSVCDFALDGTEALKLYKEQKPDVVTMDINMPKMNGIDATKEIMKYDPNAKVIIISSVDNPELRYHMLEASGVVDYLVKPVTEEKLGSLIEKMLIPKDES